MKKIVLILLLPAVLTGCLDITLVREQPVSRVIEVALVTRTPLVTPAVALPSLTESPLPAESGTPTPLPTYTATPTEAHTPTPNRTPTPSPTPSPAHTPTPTPKARLEPAFVGHLIADWAGRTDYVYFVYAADVDGDRDMDVLSASPHDNTLVWYENDGRTLPRFWPHVISSSVSGAACVHAADVDADGDLDVLSASANGHEVTWHENHGGAPPVFTTHVVTNSADGAASVFAADLDGDHDLDILSASMHDNTIAWYRSNGGSPPRFSTQVISTSAYFARAVHADDVDRDGDIDVLSASETDNTVAWYENDGARSPNFIEHIISTSDRWPKDVFTADLDGDGDIDVVSNSMTPGRLCWYENNGAYPPTFTRRTVDTNIEGGRPVHAADVNGDGRIDIIAGASGPDDKISWYDNNGAHPPTFVEHVVTATGVSSVYATDLDGDGDLDLVSTSLDGKVYWWEQVR